MERVEGEQLEQIKPVLGADGEIRGIDYEAAVRDGWFVAARFLIFDWELVLSEVKVFPGGERLAAAAANQVRRRPTRRYPDPGEWNDAKAFEGVEVAGLTTRLLRDVKIGELVDRVRAAFTEMAAVDDPQLERWKQLGETFAEIPAGRPGRAGRGDEYWAKWAAVLAAKFAEGSSAPYKAIAEEYQPMKWEQVRDVAYEVRRRGLLTGGGKTGRRGTGVLTERARELLAEMEEDD